VIRLATLCLALALATGCGGQSVSGRAVFHHDCAGCHTLAGHETGISGGDLGANRLTVGQLESFVAVMPLRTKLSRDEERAVAAYVARH